MPNLEQRKVQLNDDTWVQIEMESGREEVGLADFEFSDLSSAIGSIIASLQATIAEAKPQEASVEFGVEAGVEGGKLTALTVQGTTKANFKITLKWTSP